MANNNVKLSTYLANEIAWGRVTGKPSYYDAKAIKSITRSGTTFTYTCMDGTTGTFTQQDNNTTYTFTNKAATLAWNTAVTVATVGGVDITVKLPANPNTDHYAWADITGKPSTFTPSSHTHNYAGSSSAGGAANSANILNAYASIGSSTTDHGVALKNWFTTNKSTAPRNSIISFYSSTSNNGSQYIGYFLSGYADNPYGGFFVCHYNNPYYVGIQDGVYTQQHILTSTNYTTYTVTKTGSGASGSWGISITGSASSATNSDTVDSLHASSFARSLASQSVTFNSLASSYPSATWQRVLQTGSLTRSSALQKILTDNQDL